MTATTPAPAPSSPRPAGSRFAARYGPWALVTGASDGIGRALAVHAAELGLNVLLVARRADRLEELAATLRRDHDVAVRVEPTDLGDAAAVDQLIATTRSLDIGLVVLAAGFGTSGDFVETDRADELAMIDVNIRAVAALAHSFASRLAVRGRGGLVLVGSILGFQGVPRAANYAATKAYVQTLGEGLRAELAPRGVDVVVSAPGPVKTGFGTRADMRFSHAADARDVAVQTLAGLGRTTTVWPGALAKVLHSSLSLLPRGGRLRIMAKTMGDATAHHGS